MKLNPTTEKFILHWGEMGTKWGVNRTVAQIHALLYILGRPMNAEEITENARRSALQCQQQHQRAAKPETGAYRAYSGRQTRSF